MSDKREFTREQLPDDYETIESRPWRHGTRQRILFEEDGAHWAARIDVHHEDGWQIYGTVTATKVHKVERTVTVWESTTP